MAIRAISVRPKQALASLADSVRALKGGNPLTAVTVIVPTNATGVTARRYLGRHGGVAAVDMLTLYRLAELLGGRSLVSEGRRPVSTPVIDLAIRAVLSEHPNAFSEVADHPSTIVALRDLHRELRFAGPSSVSALAASSDRGRDSASISTWTSRTLEADWYDEGDLLSRSIAVVATSIPPQLERIVMFLPHPMRGLDVSLVRALGLRSDVTIIVAASGDPTVDGEMIESMTMLGDLVIASTPCEPCELSMISTTDADEEVRHAVRAVVNAACEGVPFARVAILWPADKPYARLVEHHLGQADIPWNGRPGTGVAERIVPRFLLDLLDVDRRGLRRRELFDLLSDVPIRDAAGALVPVARWERVSREAAVNREEHWAPRLRVYAARCRARDQASGFETSYRADDAEALIAYVAGLRRSLGHRAATRPWREWADWSERQIVSRLGQSFLARLDEPERLAWEHTNRVLDRLRHLDAIGGPARRGEFRAVFAAEFDVAPGRLGRIGSGVTIGSLSGAVGLDVDLAIIVGAADGLMPPAPNPGPLISDADRQRAGLAPSASVGLRIHRQFFSVLDAATRSIVLLPRGDLRTTSTRLPTRWLNAIAPDHPITPISSHHAALLGSVFPAHHREHRLRGLLADVSIGGSITSSADEVTGRALRLRAARRSDELTVFDGDLSSAQIDHFAGPIAPTHLEAWVSCPHAYFVHYVLGVRPVEDVADQMEISGAERGFLIHLVLDRFHREVIDGALPQPGAAGWGPEHWRRLSELFDVAADEFELSGRTGRDASWHVERQTVRTDLAQWWVHDRERVAATGATVICSERSFGAARDEVTLALPGGRRLKVKGQIDRVDRTLSGSLIVVDHKTGSATGYKGILPDDPTAGATRFQLPTYAAAALAIAGVDVPVCAQYSFFGREKYARIGYEFDEVVWAVVRDDLGLVVDGIEAGYFPNRPEPPGFQVYVKCAYCQPDSLGTGERFPDWERKRHDPRLARWFAEPELDTEADDG
jgi:ATP-dependent helicase/nuclease subunit B